MADNNLPPIPEGFVLESGQELPPMPPGFELEAGTAPFISPSEKITAEAAQQPETIGQAFTGKLRETEQTKTLPEFSATEDIEIGFDSPAEIGKKLKMTVGLMSSFSPEGQINVIKESIPEAKFEQDEKGNTIIDINGRKSVLNQPGMSAQDVAQAISGVVAFLPAAKMASLVKNVFGRALVGGGAAAATEQGIQEVSRLAGSEEERSPAKTALAGVLGAGAELVGPARQALKERSAAKKIGGEVADLVPAAESIAVAEEAAKETGIPLFQAQKTAIPAQVEKQSFLAQLPAGARKASVALKNQNKKASDAVEKFLSGIAPPESITGGAERFRTAAQKAVGAQKAIRKEKTSKLFEEAFKNKDVVNTKNLTEIISSKIDDFPAGGEISNSLKKISGLIGDGKNLKQLQNVKLEIDQMLSKFGEGSLGNTTKREVLEIKDQLLNVMDKQSPAYKVARETFAAESPAVNAIEKSIIGKVSAFDDTSLKRLSRTIFDPAETNPQVVLNAKKVIKEVDPEAWNQLLRVELERRLGSLSADVSEGGLGAVENVPKMLEKAIFGNPKQKAILKKAVDGDMLENLNFLETALKRAGLGRPGGSQTAIRKEISEEFDVGVIQTLRNWIKSPLQAIPGSVVGVGEEAARNKRIRSAAEMFFNPDFKAEVAKIKKMNPNTAAAGKATAQLLKVISSQLEENNND